jgi:hypothetical protein
VTGATQVRLTIRDGGWVLLVAAGLAGLLILWAFAGVLTGHTRQGGLGVDSYGFDLSGSIVPREQLTSSGQPRDFLQPLVIADTMPASAMQAFNETHRKRYIVSSDRVVGVTIDGHARAYPLYLLNGHEIIADTLGGVPIAVTYSPLCDAVAVYDRRVGDRVLELHLSGILHNANSLLYDAGDAPSLWRQLDGKGISGGAASRGESLKPIPNVALTTWSDWVTAVPATDVPVRIEGNVRLYESISYTREHASPQIAFPISPKPPGDLPLKAPVLLLSVGSSHATYSVDRLRAVATDGFVTTELGGSSFRIHLPTSTGSAWRVESPNGTPFVARGAFWFAAASILGERSILPAQ